MTVIGEAFIEVKPRTEGFQGAAEGGVESGLGNIAKKAALLFGGALAIGAAGEFVKKFVEAGQKADALQRVTAAVVQSTGGAAHLSAQQVGELSDKLSVLAGIDPEIVHSAENIILSFKNIKDSAGAGNDIFTQTSKAALDMATVMGTDASGAALQLSKALNDPAAGLGKLQRAGVTFTDQQKEQIKTLQASGDILGAQKIILGEVESEFGGAAEAAADPLKRLKVATDLLKESIGSALIPILAPAATALANFVSGNREKIVAGLTRALDALVGAAKFLIPGFENVAKAFGLVLDAIAPLVEAGKTLVTDVFEKLNPGLDLAAKNSETLSTSIAGLITVLAGLKIAQSVTTTIGSLVSSLGPLLSIVSAVVGPVLLITAAFIAAAAAGELLYQKVTPIRDAVDALFGKTLGPIVSALAFFNPFIPLAVGAKFLFDHVQPVHDAITGLFGVFKDLADAVSGIGANLNLGKVFSSITDTLSGLGAKVGPALSGVGDAISGAFADAPQIIQGVIDVLQSALAPAIHLAEDAWAKYGDQVSGILTGFRDIAVAVFQRVEDVARLLAGALALATKAIFDLADGVRQAAGPAFEFLRAVVEVTLSPLGAVISGTLAFIRSAFDTFIGVVGPMWDALWSLVSDVVTNVVGPISDAVEGFLGVIQGVVDIIAGIFTGDWGRIWDGFKEIANSAVEIVTAILQGLLGFLDAIWSNALTLLTLPFTTAWTIIQGVVSGGAIILQTALQAALDVLSSLWSNAETLLTAPVQAALDIIGGLLAAVVTLFTNLPGEITDALASFPGLLTDLGAAVIHGLKAGIDGAWTAVSSFFSGMGSAIVGFVGDLGSTLSAVGGSLIDGFKAGIDAAWGAVVHFFSDLPSAIVGFLGDVGSILLQAGIDLIQGLIDGIEQKAKDLPGIVGGILSDLNPLNHLPSFSVGGITIGASGMVIPGQPGQPFPLIAHGSELLLNPKQQANLMWNLANTPQVVAGNGGGTPTFIDASFHNEGTIIGIDDLEARMDAHAEVLADAVAAGRR